MHIKSFSDIKKIFIVAEIGNNHEGSVNNAIKMIEQAALCGADAVKFQTYKLDKFISTKTNKKTYKRLKKYALSYNQFEQLSDYCRKKKIIFFSTPLDIESAVFLNKIQKIFKISSGDNNYFDLIEKIFSFNKPTIISTGMTTSQDIKKVYKSGLKYFKKNIDKKLSFLHCVSDYPVEDKFVNLLSISYLKTIFPDIKIGYSDHSIGTTACISAAVLGAKIIEKHFTLDKNFSNFRDHKLSADPSDLKHLVTEIRRIETIMGKEEKKIQQNEKKNLISARRSYAFNKIMNEGKKISEDDLIMLRPKKGLNNKYHIIGKKIKRKIKEGIFIKKEYLK